MRNHRPTLLHRTLCAALGLQMLAASCGVSAMSLSPEPMAWPTPAPPHTSIARPLPIRVLPNFEAPSASHCARPIVTREVPGGAADTAVAREREASRGDKSARTSALTDSSASSAVPVAPAAAAASPVASGSGAAVAKLAAPSKAATVAMPQPSAAPQQSQRQQAVTAGLVTDNADFSEYLAFRNRTQVAHRPRDVRERYLLEVKDAQGLGVPDAEVAVRSAQGQAMWARTDTAGRAWLHPDAFDPAHAATYSVDTLDRLIVRLVREELAPLVRPDVAKTLGYNLGLR